MIKIIPQPLAPSPTPSPSPPPPPPAPLLFDELANQYAALPQLQPAYYQPQQHIDLQAARREEESVRDCLVQLMNSH